MDMNPNNLVLRCYAVRSGDTWEAFCLDLTLAAQGKSFDEVRRKLDDQICSYVIEAVTIHKDYSDQLLTRKAPWTEWAKYYLIYTDNKLKNLFRVYKEGVFQAFTECMPLLPQAHHN
jgi:hypothetical protein